MVKNTEKSTLKEGASLSEVLSSIQKGLSVPKSQYNKFGNYYYRNCEDILEAVKTLLPDGYFVTLHDSMILVGDRYYLEATAVLGNGVEKISCKALARESLDRKGMDDSQITGSTSSYARKYALNGLFAIDDSKDADSTEPVSTKKLASDPVNHVEPKIETKKDIEEVKTGYIYTAAGSMLSKAYFAKMRQLGIDAESAKEKVKKAFKLESYTEVSKEQLQKIMQSINEKEKEKRDKEFLDSLDGAVEGQ